MRRRALKFEHEFAQVPHVERAVGRQPPAFSNPLGRFWLEPGENQLAHRKHRSGIYIHRDEYGCFRVVKGPGCSSVHGEMSRVAKDVLDPFQTCFDGRPFGGLADPEFRGLERR